MGVAPLAHTQTTDTIEVLQEISISTTREGVKRMAGAVNGTEIGQDELFRAACCNLGESFVNNPSVDVNYNDASVGAKQIKLLGLDGQYVQMLCEGLPLPVGVAQPYLLGRVPGSWMRSISVSKGASSVKNGPQGITGQIDVEYMKPDEDQGLLVNIYGDSHRKMEGNVVGNIHLNERLSTEIMAHYEKDFMHHDENGDGWIDLPTVEQYNASNRWKYTNGRYIMHAGVSMFGEERHGGTMAGHMASYPDIKLKSNGLDAYMKHAFLLDPEHNTNLAFMGNYGIQDFDGRLGIDAIGEKLYTVGQQHMNTQLILEHEFTEAHMLSTGLSLAGEWMDENYNRIPQYSNLTTDDITPGIYAQYTYKPSYRFTAMAGLRADHSSLHSRTYATPRLHVKWLPTDWLTLRGSIGKGYRTAHPLAEHHNLATSGRTLLIDPSLPLEEAWNTGASAVFYVPLGGRQLTLSAEYFYTNFNQQVILDFDSDPSKLHITSLDGKSFSHTLQVDATYEPSDEWSILAALRLNDVRCTYGGVLMEKPLQSRYKALLTIGWEPLMALWHVDVTLQLNGPGRMPTPYPLSDGSPSWDERFPACPQLNMQITRDFRHFSVYIGGENLTNYRQPVPVVDAANPQSTTFDPTMVWGPVLGIMAYAGIRMNFWRM
ncbi:MAG: TonB-dependent receptor [Bacteroidales bacterium]|nr:TonB-dependent receptor [Bacteroidales bacterium]